MSNHSHSASDFIREHWSKFDKNTCFICASDRLAIGIERGIQLMGGDLPKDFGTIGFDGVFLNQIASPNLTTVEQPEVEMGKAIAQMAIDKVEENNMPQGMKLFEPALIVGGSTR